MSNVILNPKATVVEMATVAFFVSELVATYESSNALRHPAPVTNSGAFRPAVPRSPTTCL